jgi:phage anti-repressor protein
MAKEDFCFTYYDGDAARDKAHMDRLERGAYDDLISAQRKRGHLSLEDIKKVLSKDFERCWPSLEWILKTDDQNKYFIEWVEKSVEKSRAYSKKQSDRIKQFWDKKKNQNQTPEEPRLYHGINSEEPLEDGDGYITTILKQLECNNDLVIEENEKTNFIMLIIKMIEIFRERNPNYFFHKETDYSACLTIAYHIAEMNKWKRATVLDTNKDACLQYWETIVVFIQGDDWLSKRSLTDLSKITQWQRLVQQMQNNGTYKQSINGNGSKPGTSASRLEALRNF